MIRLPRLSVLFVLIFSVMLFVQAQDNVPVPVFTAVEDLSTRTGRAVTLDNLSSFEWVRNEYGDTSLGCPQDDMMYAQVLTDGYRILIEYQQQLYDYRVSADSQIVILCTTEVIAVPTCPQTVMAQEGDTPATVASRCGLSVSALLAVNPGIDETLNIGRILTIPGGYTAPLPGSVPALAVYPQSVRAGGAVEVITNGFPPGAPVTLSISRSGKPVETGRTVTADSFGSIRTDVIIPVSAGVDEQWVIVATVPDASVSVTSNPVYVNDSRQGNEVNTDGQFSSVNIYLVDRNTGSDNEDFDLCEGEESLVAVRVEVDPTIAPLAAALRELINLDVISYQGFYNGLSGSDLSLESVNLTDGVADVILSGELLAGDACNKARIMAQIEQTALQYFNVDEVQIALNGEALADVLNEG